MVGVVVGSVVCVVVEVANASLEFKFENVFFLTYWYLTEKLIQILAEYLFSNHLIKK